MGCQQTKSKKRNQNKNQEQNKNNLNNQNNDENNNNNKETNENNESNKINNENNNENNKREIIINEEEINTNSNKDNLRAKNFNVSNNGGNIDVQVSQIKNKIKIFIPYDEKIQWEKEFDPDDSINKVIETFKQENSLEIPEKFNSNWEFNNKSLDLNAKISTLLENDNNNLIFNYKNNLDNISDIEINNDNNFNENFAKPFSNPFEIFLFNKTNQIFRFIDLENNENQTEIYAKNSAYCNGNNHLFISGGEFNNKEISNNFFDINLQTNEIISYKINDFPPKKNHSMIFLPKKYVFIIGGNNKNSYYFNTEKKTFENYSNLNNIRIEPALFVMNNKILYVFDNLNNIEKELTFEKTDFDKKPFFFELIKPKFNEEENIKKMNQKFFGCVALDEKNIIFLGGNMEKNNNNKNYIFNTDENTINFSDVDFKQFNLNDKNFYAFNNNSFFNIIDFNKNSPEIVFFNKNQGSINFRKFNKISNENDNLFNNNSKLKSKKKLNKFDFDMPSLHSSYLNNNSINNNENENKNDENSEDLNSNHLNNNENQIHLKFKKSSDHFQFNDNSINNEPKNLNLKNKSNNSNIIDPIKNFNQSVNIHNNLNKTVLPDLRSSRIGLKKIFLDDDFEHIKSDSNGNIKVNVPDLNDKLNGSQLFNNPYEKDFNLKEKTSNFKSKNKNFNDNINIDKNDNNKFNIDINNNKNNIEENYDNNKNNDNINVDSNIKIVEDPNVNKNNIDNNNDNNIDNNNENNIDNNNDNNNENLENKDLNSNNNNNIEKNDNQVNLNEESNIKNNFDIEPKLNINLEEKKDDNNNNNNNFQIDLPDDNINNNLDIIRQNNNDDDNNLKNNSIKVDLDGIKVPKMLAHLTTLEEPKINVNGDIKNSNNFIEINRDLNNENSNSILKNQNIKNSNNLNIIVPEVHNPNNNGDIHPKFIIDNSENVINVPNVNIKNNNPQNEDNKGKILKSYIIDDNNKVSLKIVPYQKLIKKFL